MPKCQNCGILISCNCVIRTASDGKQVCSSCIDSYEYKLKVQKEAGQNK